MQSVKSLQNLTCALPDRRGRDWEKLVWVFFFFKKEKRGTLKMICKEGVGMNLVPAGGAQGRRTAECHSTWSRVKTRDRHTSLLLLGQR